MPLLCPLPEDVQRRIAGAAGDGGTVRYAVTADLTLGRRYGTTYVAMTEKHLVACDGDGRTLALPLADIKEATVDELFGSGCLVVDTAAGRRDVAYYTKVCVPEVAALCRVLNDLREGRTPELPTDDEPSHCRRCGLPLPERGEHCPMCVPTWQIFRRLLEFVRPYKTRVAVLMLANLVTVASQTGPPYLTKLIVDGVVRTRDASRLPIYIGGMLGCGLALLLSRYVSGAFTSWLAGRVVADIREKLHVHLQGLPMRYFNRRESGEMVSRVMHDTGELRQFLVEGLPFLLVNSLSFVTIALILLRLDRGLTLLVLLPVPFLVGGGAWFWRRLIPLFHKFGNRMERVHTVLGESIHGIKAIKVLSREASRAAAFDHAAEGLFGVSFAIDKTFVGFFETMFWLMSVGVVAVWYVAARRIGGPVETAFSLGDLLAFVGYIWLLYGPLQWFTAILNWMSHAFSGAERIFAMLDSKPEVYEPPDAVPLPTCQGAIGFRDVRFSYERGKEVLRGVSFDIAPGEMIGLVGKSGAGKSTLINLVCRFYDADSGQITLDGHPVAQVRLADLRRHIGIVMQDTFVFNATIVENIRYGTPDATFDDVVRAAGVARAHDFILEKEDGYDTLLGEGGATLSGGEKQRIAIARAVLNDPRILIFDEATSSVDSETEKAIQEAITALVAGRTTIAIAHRLSTLRHANRLFVIDDGRLVETGTHDELMARDGEYAKLVKIQTELSRLRSEVWQE